MRKGAAPEECASATERHSPRPGHAHSSNAHTHLQHTYFFFCLHNLRHIHLRSHKSHCKKHDLYHKYGVCKFPSYSLNTLTLIHTSNSTVEILYSLSVFQFYLTVIGVTCFQQSRKQIGGILFLIVFIFKFNRHVIFQSF